MLPCLAALLVLLDPGHDPSSPGATSARGVQEFRLNEEIVGLVEKELASVPGLETGRTRREGEAVAPRERGLRANARKAGLLLSFHHDAVHEEETRDWEVDGHAQRYSDVARGFSIHVRGDRPEAVAIARSIGNALKSAGFVPTDYHRNEFPVLDAALGIYDRQHLAMLNAAEVPAVLVEVGFIVHREEELELRRPEVRARFAKAVRTALEALARPVTRSAEAGPRAGP